MEFDSFRVPRWLSGQRRHNDQSWESVRDEEENAGISLSVKNDYEYEKFKATFWVDSQKNEYGEYEESEPVIEFRNEHGNLIKQIKAAFGNLYDVELDIKDVETLEIWVRGSLSIIGEPKIGK